MDFVTFSVNTTNIFPIANSTAGGQLATEYNLRARESVATSPKVSYMIGPSFVHSAKDYEVCLQTDGYSDTAISSTTLEIKPGRAVINGHFVESLVPMLVDLAEANAQLSQEHKNPLKGDLCIGIRAMYSTQQTIAGTMLAETDSMMYEGVKVVVLPKSQFILPTDDIACNDESKITAHIKLAEFTYKNGQITSITNNPDKLKYLDVERLIGITDAISGNFLSATGLDPNKIYTFSGRSADKNYQGSNKSKETWCDSTDSLMIWDKSPALKPKAPILYDSATFYADSSDDKVRLFIPHKQPNGVMKNTSGTLVHYPPVELELPLADFNKGTPGTVSKEYTAQVKAIASKFTNLYHIPNGKQLMYLPELNSREVGNITPENPYILPVIQDNWRSGDYVLVGLDNTALVNQGYQAPSTMYTILPGRVLQIAGTDEVIAVSDATKALNELLGKRSEAQASLQSAQSALESVAAAKNNVDSLISQLAEVANDVGTTDGLSATNLDTADGTSLAESAVVLDHLVSQAQDAAKKAEENIQAAIDAMETPVDVLSTSVDAVYTDLDNMTSGDGQAITCQTYIHSVYDICKTNYDAAVSVYTQLVAQCDGAMNADGTVDTTTANYKLNYALGTVVTATPPSGVELGTFDTTEDPAQLSIDEVNNIWALGQSSIYRGVEYTDYFTIRYTDSGGTVTNYYYVVVDATERTYSDPIILTREIGLATESTIGGFYNLPDDTTDIMDAGYVYLDDTGHLRLLDYSLLRSGTLAYQLGEDFSTPSGLDSTGVQEYLNEYVNQRVAFPNYAHSQSAENPNVINITLNLTASEEYSEINLYDVDCRFNTCIYVHITGDANQNTTINISDCAKIRIDSNISGTPIINLYRSNLYYDANVIDYLKTPQLRPVDNLTVTPIVTDMRLWYEKFYEDYPNLVVDNMTVREVDGPIVSEEVDYWDKMASNDNHYLYALRSITFSSDANIIGCEIYVKNGSTANIDVVGKSILSSGFRLPQGGGLTYPRASLTRSLKVTGTFVTAYYKGADSGQDTFAVMTTNFTAVSQVYNPYQPDTYGTISFLTQCDEVTDIGGVDMDAVRTYGAEIPGWDRSFHIFSGGVLG